MTTNDRDPRDPRAFRDRDAARGATGDADGAGERPGTLRTRVPSYTPPAELEERVISSLTARGLLAPGSASFARWRGWRTVGLLAAALALFIAGGAAERVRASAATEDELPATPRFALLLYDGPTNTTPDEEAALVAEYSGWAQDLAQAGRYVGGEKLGDTAIELGTAVPDEPSQLVGFFIIGAGSAEEAEAIARTTPHLRHGGRVVVRPIEPT